MAKGTGEESDRGSDRETDRERENDRGRLRNIEKTGSEIEKL